MRDSVSSQIGFGVHTNEYAYSGWFSRTIRVRSPLWHVYDWRILTEVFWAKNSPKARFAFQLTLTILTSCRPSMCCGKSTNYLPICSQLRSFCTLPEGKRHRAKDPYGRQRGNSTRPDYFRFARHPPRIVG